jgi:hypothetical protein
MITLFNINTDAVPEHLIVRLLNEVDDLDVKELSHLLLATISLEEATHGKDGMLNRCVYNVSRQSPTYRSEFYKLIHDGIIMLIDATKFIDRAQSIFKDIDDNIGDLYFALSIIGDDHLVFTKDLVSHCIKYRFYLVACSMTWRLAAASVDTCNWYNCPTAHVRELKLSVKDVVALAPYYFTDGGAYKLLNDEMVVLEQPQGTIDALEELSFPNRADFLKVIKNYDREPLSILFDGC